MSKKIQETTETTGLDTVNDSLTEMTQKVQDNKKSIITVISVLLAIVAAGMIYFYFVHTPGVQKENDQIGAADLEFALGNDSVAMAQYMTLADNGSHDAANRAALQSAILLYQDAKYEEALKYLEKYSVEDEIIGAGAQSLKGDCLVNLDRLDEAANAFNAAITTSDNNPAYTPYFMIKLARVYAAQNKHNEEAAIYEKIVREYPLYGQSHNLDIEKYLERARIQAGK